MASCSKCGYPVKRCQNPAGSGLPDCPTIHHAETIQEALEKYGREPVHSFALAAAAQEAAGYCHDEEGEAYPVKTRLQETLEFSRRMGYKRIGLAFCIGLIKEAATLSDILASHGFEVVSVLCKAGGVTKESFGLGSEDQIHPGEIEMMCNPVAQAEICNREATDFNIVMGLCVGHDALFLKHSQAFCTVFAVKDRVLAHNPMGAIYTSNSYYKRLRGKAVGKDKK